jgi:hypothetical protein
MIYGTRARHLLFALACALAVACGSDPIPDPGFLPMSDAGPTFTLRVEPPMSKAAAKLGGPAPSLGFNAIRTENGKDTDVTDQVEWSAVDPTLGTGSSIATVSKGVATFGGKVAGELNVVASLAGVTGAAKATFTVAGDVFGPGTDPSTKAAFEAAPIDATQSPELEYPMAATVLPQNLPPVQFQWSKSDGTQFRTHFTSPILDVWVYGTTAEWTPDKDTWKLLLGSTPDAPAAGTSWLVETLSPTKVRRASQPRTFNAAIDSVDDGAIYVWQSSTGTFRVIDVSQGKDFPLPTDSPQLAAGQPCSGCHRISRDGKRFAYTYNGAEFNFGTLAFDAASKLYKPKIVPAPSFRATYASFDPLEGSRVPAMLVTVPDTVPSNTAGTVRLELRDPDTNAVVPSNLAAAQAMLAEPNPGRGTSMPDWSPDGSFIVFAAYSSATNFVRLLGDETVNASLVEMPVSYAGGTYSFGAPKVLVAADTAANPDTGDNYNLPAVSPDGSAVAYTHSNGWWSIKNQASPLNLSGNIELVRRSDGKSFALGNGSPGVGASNTWPQWAPTNGKRYAWLAYASERSYGHVLTPQNQSCGGLAQGQKSCKQLWIMAVDLAKLKSGTVDPSFAPFWIPGQSINAQYVSPQWTKALVKPPN